MSRGIQRRCLACGRPFRVLTARSRQLYCLSTCMDRRKHRRWLARRGILTTR